MPSHLTVKAQDERRDREKNRAYFEGHVEVRDAINKTGKFGEEKHDK